MEFTSGNTAKPSKCFLEVYNLKPDLDLQLNTQTDGKCKQSVGEYTNSIIAKAL